MRWEQVATKWIAVGVHEHPPNIVLGNPPLSMPGNPLRLHRLVGSKYLVGGFFERKVEREMKKKSPERK